MDSGRCSRTLRRLWTWQRWTTAVGPHVSRIALRSPVPPSITKSTARSRSRPRSPRSARSALQTVAFSVVPSRRARTCFWPWESTPSASRITWSRKCSPSRRTLRTLRSSRGLREPRRQSGARQRDEAARDAALRDRPLPDPLGQRVERPAILARRDADRDRLQRTGVKRIPASSVGEAREVEFMAVDTAGTQPRHEDATATQRDLAARAPTPVGPAGGFGAVLSSAEQPSVGPPHVRSHWLVRLQAT